MRAKNHIALSLAMSLLITSLQAQEALSAEDPSHIIIDEQQEPELDQQIQLPEEPEAPPPEEEPLQEEPSPVPVATEATLPLIELPKESSTAGLEAFWQAHAKSAPTGSDWYELAILQIKAGQRADAETSLIKALAANPHSAAALTQLGFLFLWNAQDQKAYYYFDQALKSEPCYKPAVAGLVAVAALWSQKKFSERTAYFTLERALQCDPKNADVLFYLGRLLAKWQCYKEAERYLIAALREAPDYSDAAVVLAGIYFQQKKLRAAEILYERFADKNDDAKAGLARLSLYCGDPCRAKELYEEVAAKHPCDEDSGQGLARALAKLRCFCRAEQEYMWLIKHDCCNESLWRESFETRSHIKPRIWLESSYLQAKENDPSVGVPVVRDFYFREGLHVWLPLAEVWRLDLKQIYNSQKEDDIFPPTGVNYNVHQNGLQATSQYFFATDWRFDLTLRGFYASGSQNVFFPFDKTTRIEPGALFLYKSDYRMLAVEGHTESFIIKNFSVNRSQLLMMNVVSAGYGATPDWPFKPEVELWAGWQFYGDNLENLKNFQTFYTKFAVPMAPKGFFLHYFFEHGHFKALSQNYYSYKQQIRNTIGIRYRYDYCDRAYGEFIYEHRWQNTHNLFQPIGSFIFTANQQMLLCNKYILNLVYRLKDRWLFEATGHYYRDTLPYREWKVGGTISYQF